MLETLTQHPFIEQPENTDTRLVRTVEATARPEARAMFAQGVSERIKKTQGVIVVNSHMSPDPDAVCSSLALSRHLRKIHPDRQFQVAFSDPSMKVFNALQRAEGEILWIGAQKKLDPSGRERPGDVADHTGLKICLDGAREDRFSKVPDQLSPIIILDHHPEEANRAELRYTEPSASSTCELIARMYPLDSFDADVAGLLWLGIMRDTQGFRIPMEYGDLRDVASKLLQKSGKSAEQLQGLIPKSDQQKVYEEIFKRHIKSVEKPGMPRSKYSYMTISETNPTVPVDDVNYVRGEARRDFMFDLSQTGDSELYWTFIPRQASIRSGFATEYSISFRRSNNSKIDLNSLAKRVSTERDEKKQGGGLVAAASTTIQLTPTEIKYIQDEKAKNPTFNEMDYVGSQIVNKVESLFKPQPAEIKPEADRQQRGRPQRERRAP